MKSFFKIFNKKFKKDLFYSLVNFTPPLRPDENVPLPRPPAKIWALITSSLAIVFTILLREFFSLLL